MAFLSCTRLSGITRGLKRIVSFSKTKVQDTKTYLGGWIFSRDDLNLNNDGVMAA